MLKELKNKIKAIPIIYKTYMWIKRKTILKWEHNKKVRVFHKNGYIVLDQVERELAKSELKTFISFGTLLGFVREKAIIAYDDDIDICIINQNCDEWAKLNSVMKKCEMKKTREIFLKGNVVISTYSKNGVNIDFYLFDMIEGKPVTYSFLPLKDYIYKGELCERFRVIEYHYPIVQELEEKTIHDTFLILPKNAMEIIKFLYGEEWNIPDRKFSDATNAKYIEKIKIITYQ